MIDKFDKIFNESLSEFGIILNEQEPADPMAAQPAAAPVDEEPVAPPVEEVPDGDIDSNSLNVNLVELARKALLVEPSAIDQGSKGLLSQHVDMNNVEAMEKMINEIISIEAPVDAEPTISYNNNI